MEPLRRRNHWVPASYLAPFTQDGSPKGVLAIYDRQRPGGAPHYSGADAAARERDMYVVKRDDGELDDRIEHFLANEIESPFVPIRNLLAFGLEVGFYRRLSRLDHQALCYFLAFQHLRTPRMRETLHHFLVFQGLVLTRGALLDLDDAQQTYLKATGKRISKEQLADLKDAIDTERILIKPGSTSWLRFALPLAVDLAKEIRSLQFRVVDATPGVTFPASDTPVVVARRTSTGNYSLAAGWLEPDAEITIPLSPTTLLVLGSRLSQFRDIGSPDWCRAIRTRTIHAAERWVYTYPEAHDIPRVLATTKAPSMAIYYPGGVFRRGESVARAVRHMMDINPGSATIAFAPDTE